MKQPHENQYIGVHTCGSKEFQEPQQPAFLTTLHVQEHSTASLLP